jgi:hypothetical protein
MDTLEPTSHNAPLAPVPSPQCERPRILVLEPDGERRSSVARGLKALGYRAETYSATNEIPRAAVGRWLAVLTASTLPQCERSRLEQFLQSLGSPQPPIHSLQPVYDAEDQQAEGAESDADSVADHDRPWTDDFKLRLLRWVSDEGPAVLRPIPCPAAVLGHAYPRLEKRNSSAGCNG